MLLTADEKERGIKLAKRGKKIDNCSFYLSMRFTLITSKCVGLIGFKAQCCLLVDERQETTAKCVCVSVSVSACKHALNDVHCNLA